MQENIESSFEERIYLSANPDVEAAIRRGEYSSGLEHYQQVGKNEGRVASAQQFVLEQSKQLRHQMQVVSNCNQQLDALRSSTSWRITEPLRAIVRSLRGKSFRTDRKAHVKSDAQEFKHPSSFPVSVLETLPAGFDSDIYVKLNPDLAEAGVDPAAHYLLHGCREGRSFSMPDESSAKFDKRLPVDFDKEMYLKLNPDLAEAGSDPVAHYLSHGCLEGRTYSLPKLDIRGDDRLKGNVETVLVVSHEASLTGAPVLSLNLAIALLKRNNVVVLLLGGGPLADLFRYAGASVLTISNSGVSPAHISLIVDELCERFNFKFALVNSIESRAVLPSLSKRFVPTITLIHEFASYTRPRDAFRNAFLWSGEVVFSAKVVLENALAEYSDLNERSAHILAQGRCLLPGTELNDEKRKAESLLISRLMRPSGHPEDTFVVLGAGLVQLRKGVDLFIECAARIAHSPGGAKFRFVWIGKGYDPDNDIGYSVYLADQIRRAGLQGSVVFLKETTAIEAAYKEADLFLLSSRLDPLPNVAIDAMAHGLPVLCYNKTTGIADFLIKVGLGDSCVADYLDSSDMVVKLLAFSNSKALRDKVSSKTRSASVSYFNFSEYITGLEGLAQAGVGRMQQEKIDTKVILESGLFRRDFSCPPHLKYQQESEAIRSYVRSWAAGIGRRKPFPGFHPGIYLEQHGLVTKGADPFADYLRAGQPVGAWNCPVIVAHQVADGDLPESQRVALHIHVHYPELLHEIITRLSRNIVRPDLFISITDEKIRESVIDGVKNYRGKVVDIQLVPNRGRDIGPLLTTFGQRFIKDYEFVGHIHTKKSVDVTDSSVGKSWYRFLLENLLGGDVVTGMADSILATLESDPALGMVFPDDPNILGWGGNQAFATPLADKLGLKLPEHFIFPVGTMFWARTRALAPLVDLTLHWESYPEEPLPYDGTTLHAIERLISLVSSLNNFGNATTNIFGLSR